jgi:hypothetical protein
MYAARVQPPHRFVTLLVNVLVPDRHANRARLRHQIVTPEILEDVPHVSRSGVHSKARYSSPLNN